MTLAILIIFVFTSIGDIVNRKTLYLITGVISAIAFALPTFLAFKIVSIK